MDSIFVEFLRLFFFESACSQSACNQSLTIDKELRPSAGHMGRSYPVNPLAYTST